MTSARASCTRCCRRAWTNHRASSRAGRRHTVVRVQLAVRDIRLQLEVSVIQDGADPSVAKVVRAHSPPQGARENLVCALKLLATVQAGGDNLVDTIFEGSPDVLRRGELEKNSEAPTFDSATFPDATMGEGVDELTLRV